MTNINLPVGQKSTMEHVQGDLLDAPSHFCLAHCCSEDLKLGAGVARTIQEVFGVRSEMARQDHSVGTAVLASRRGRKIYNLVTKAKFYEKPNYYNLEMALVDLRNKMLANGDRFLAIPELGCGRDALQLSIVIEIIAKVFWQTNFHIVMCHFRPDWETRPQQGTHLC